MATVNPNPPNPDQGPTSWALVVDGDTVAPLDGSDYGRWVAPATGTYAFSLTPSPGSTSAAALVLTTAAGQTYAPQGGPPAASFIADVVAGTTYGLVFLPGTSGAGVSVVFAATPLTPAAPAVDKDFIVVRRPGGGPRRATMTLQGTGAAGAVITGAAPFVPGYTLYSIATDRVARVRIYLAEADRDADKDRDAATAPVGDHGVVLDYVAADTSTKRFNPPVGGWTTGASLPFTITNTGNSVQTVKATLTYVRTE